MKGVGRSNVVLLAVLLGACDETPARPGAITGTVRTTAQSAPRRPLPESVRRVCGDEAEDPTLTVSAQGGVRNAVVWVADEKPTPPGGSPTPVLDQRRCTSFPPVLVGHTGGK